MQSGVIKNLSDDYHFIRTTLSSVWEIMCFREHNKFDKFFSVFSPCAETSAKSSVLTMQTKMQSRRRESSTRTTTSSAKRSESMIFIQWSCCWRSTSSNMLVPGHFNQCNQWSPIIYAIATTAYARLKLFKALRKLKGVAILYMDTDSSESLSDNFTGSRVCHERLRRRALLGHIGRGLHPGRSVIWTGQARARQQGEWVRLNQRIRLSRSVIINHDNQSMHQLMQSMIIW